MHKDDLKILRAFRFQLMPPKRVAKRRKMGFPPMSRKDRKEIESRFSALAEFLGKYGEANFIGYPASRMFSVSLRTFGHVPAYVREFLDPFRDEDGRLEIPMDEAPKPHMWVASRTRPDGGKSGIPPVIWTPKYMIVEREPYPHDFLIASEKEIIMPDDTIVTNEAYVP